VALWIASRFGSLSDLRISKLWGVGSRPAASVWTSASNSISYRCDAAGRDRVGFLIHIYSVEIHGHEGGYYRFFAYLNLFMFFMLTLVLGNNYLLMFVGWEGVGLASYL